jgi:hypothetical protein
MDLITDRGTCQQICTPVLLNPIKKQCTLEEPAHNAADKGKGRPASVPETGAGQNVIPHY